MKKLKIIISGGGTGGHIFPALSIAGEIKDRMPETEILFVGALGKMEMQRVPDAGYKIVGLPVMGMPRKISLKMITFILKLFKSMRKAGKIIKTFQPDIVIGVGGFASGPILKMAEKKNIPTVLQEQNSYAGITNKLLAKKVKKICVAYYGMEKYFPKEKLVFTGNPVRKQLLEETDKKEALKKYGLEEGKPVLLILGGSQGARTINESVMAHLGMINSGGVQIIWQTGSFYYKEMMNRVEGKCPKLLKPYEFLTHMEFAYKAADLVISRSGAGTISELCLLGKSSILVPSPNVAEDHQTKNAMALANKQAAIMVKDSESIERLIPEAFKLIKDDEKLRQMSENSKKLARPNAASEIVDVIIDVINHR